MSLFDRLFVSKPGALLSKAREVERNGNPEEALELYNQIIFRFPDSSQAQQARMDVEEITNKPTRQIVSGNEQQTASINSQFDVTSETVFPLASRSPEISRFLELYSKDIARLAKNPTMPASMRQMLASLKADDWIQVLRSALDELTRLALLDNESHSKQYSPTTNASPFISVSIWPNTNALSLADRFQEEIGIPYYEAQIKYANHYRAHGGCGFAHLFFYSGGGEIGVATAFIPYSDDTTKWALILPESIQRQTERLLSQIGL